MLGINALIIEEVENTFIMKTRIPAMLELSINVSNIFVYKNIDILDLKQASSNIFMMYHIPFYDNLEKR